MWDRKILIIDPDHIFRRHAEELLTLAHNEVVQAHTYTVARDCLDHYDVDLVIIEHELNVMGSPNGLSGLALVLDRNFAPYIPRVLTSLPSAEKFERLLKDAYYPAKYYSKMKPLARLCEIVAGLSKPY